MFITSFIFNFQAWLVLAGIVSLSTTGLIGFLFTLMEILLPVLISREICSSSWLDTHTSILYSAPLISLVKATFTFLKIIEFVKFLFLYVAKEQRQEEGESQTGGMAHQKRERNNEIITWPYKQTNKHPILVPCNLVVDAHCAGILDHSDPLLPASTQCVSTPSEEMPSTALILAFPNNFRLWWRASPWSILLQ